MKEIINQLKHDWHNDRRQLITDALSSVAVLTICYIVIKLSTI